MPPGGPDTALKSVRVYATGQGAICAGCGRPTRECACSASGARPREDGFVRVSRQTRGRKGKGVTLITGLPLDGSGLAALATELKQRCGAGGSVKAGVIEIQGDHRDLLVAELLSRGLRVKKAGG